MQRTVTTRDEFEDAWAGNDNFMMDGACVPFEFDLPPLADLVDMLRRDDEVRILVGSGDKTDIRDDFRRLPIEKALESRFHLSHFALERFYGPGQCLHGFETRVMDPWRTFLRGARFSWERCYPILFLAGPGSGSAYHMDCSHVVAWQWHGTKTFSGLREPERYSPVELAVQKRYRDALYKPELKAEDVVAYEQTPGTVLWNQLLTPHWVEAGDEAAASLNLSHGFLRHRGALCRNEQALADYWAAHPKEAWRRKTA